jgi:hypothetical protein
MRKIKKQRKKRGYYGHFVKIQSRETVLPNLRLNNSNFTSRYTSTTTTISVLTAHIVKQALPVTIDPGLFSFFPFSPGHTYTPSGLVNEVVLDMI